MCFGSLQNLEGLFKDHIVIVFCKYVLEEES